MNDRHEIFHSTWEVGDSTFWAELWAHFGDHQVGTNLRKRWVNYYSSALNEWGRNSGWIDTNVDKSKVGTVIKYEVEKKSNYLIMK